MTTPEVAAPAAPAPVPETGKSFKMPFTMSAPDNTFHLLLGCALFGAGYALAYYAINILILAYSPNNTSPMNPAPLAVLFGLSDPNPDLEPTQ